MRQNSPEPLRPALVLVAASLLAVAGCSKSGLPPQPAPGERATALPASHRGARPILRLYSGAGIRPAVAELVDVFEARHNVQIQCDYGGSNMIFGRLKVARRGDIFIPGDVRYVKMAEKEGLIASSVPVCYFVPVILVVKGNPKGIHTVRDLLKPGVKIGLGDEKACAIGKVSRRIFEKNGLDPAEVEKHVAFRSLTVNELGTQVVVGKLDAAIVWDATARQYQGKADVVEIPPNKNVISTVPVAVLTCSQHPDLARAFQQFAASDEGKQIWAKHGYTVKPPQPAQTIPPGQQREGPKRATGR